MWFLVVAAIIVGTIGITAIYFPQTDGSRVRVDVEAVLEPAAPAYLPHFHDALHRVVYTTTVNAKAGKRLILGATTGDDWPDTRISSVKVDGVEATLLAEAYTPSDVMAGATIWKSEPLTQDNPTVEITTLPESPSEPPHGLVLEALEVSHDIAVIDKIEQGFTDGQPATAELDVQDLQYAFVVYTASNRSNGAFSGITQANDLDRSNGDFHNAGFELTLNTGIRTISVPNNNANGAAMAGISFRFKVIKR